MKRYVKLIIGCALALFFIWLVLRNVDIRELGALVRQAKIGYIFSAVCLFFLGYICRIERWRLMLTQNSPGLRWKECAGPFMASISANNVLPFRAGDILRVFGFNKRLRVSASISITSLIVERLLDLLMMTSFLGIALTYFGMDSSKLVGVGGWALVIAGLVILFLLIFPSAFRPLSNCLCRMVATRSPTIGAKIELEFSKIFDALAHSSRGTMMLRLIFWSGAAWIFEGLVYWMVALSIPSISNAVAAWLALPVGTFATVIPSTPGYVGTFDYFATQAMAVLGNTAGSATAFALLVHAVLWLPATAVGGFYLLANPVGKRENVREYP